MKNARGEVLGVLQLLNRKRDRTTRLLPSTDLDQEVEAFPWRAVRLAESLASQAAVAYENGQLYENIQRLFDGFVKAAVTAIEQRDPTTSGHSSRVAIMTLGLAEAMNRVQTGPYAQVYFSPDQMKEMKYASLLHDFGKIAVREDVLIKAKKLYPSQLAIIEQRFEYLHQLLETERMEKKLDAALQSAQNRSGQFGEIDQKYDAQKADLQECFQSVLDLNEVTILPEQNERQLTELSRRTYLDRKGIRRNILTPAEIASLSVREGSLNDDERQEIESHVMHSFNFLIHIPWTPELRYIPWIVRAHHEKLNGKGYPHGLRGEEIPLQARMMIICDIFDALASADRPYKKAVTPRQACAILESAVHKGELDAELYRIFIDAKISDLIAPSSERRLEDEENISVPHLQMLDTK
jgi:HD-GYP domain-containing protein (c-di-GMP phosphodiesterase class II)